MIGAKPPAVCRWIFGLLGAGPQDTLDDLFPGSGAVSRAWAAFTRQPEAVASGFRVTRSLQVLHDASAVVVRDASFQARADASLPAAHDASFLSVRVRIAGYWPG